MTKAPVFLIADDSQAKMFFLRTLVQKAGWNDILTAETTKEAKKLIDTHPITDAFIDYFIPSENGPAVIAYLRKKHPKAHIALVTSSESQRVMEEATAAGAEKAISTSVEERELVEEIEVLLAGWREQWGK